MEKLLTVAEVAEYLQVSTKTISRFIKAKKIRAFKIGKDWRFKMSDIEEYLENNSNFKDKK